MKGLIILYITCGIVTLIFDWNVNQSKLYKELKKKQMTEDSMACIYMLLIITFWPIKILNMAIRKIRSYF